MARYAVISRSIAVTIAMTKNKEACRSQSVSDEVDRHDVIQNLVKLPGERDRCRQNALQGNRYKWCLRARINARNLLEKKFVFGHCKVNARRSQDTLTEKSNRRDSDTDGDQARSAFTQTALHPRRI